MLQIYSFDNKGGYFLDKQRLSVYNIQRLSGCFFACDIFLLLFNISVANLQTVRADLRLFVRGVEI